ncbi:hypothetical protein SBOR_8672 [Sclerotinia borealis F-4128]|uniref:AB hydrolase-1 domain-containing protein n=1 Tax=Sclerotinia borealis (strain F-4128) TaxID=1432307 RepID=W9C7U8_SCLBF|nr:hypothetical protein SBOR_8672 [Sclerotinia borealis F-4128]
MDASQISRMVEADILEQSLDQINQNSPNAAALEETIQIDYLLSKFPSVPIPEGSIRAAIYSTSTDVFSALLRKDATIINRQFDRRRTSIALAYMNKQPVEFLEFMLKAGADPNQDPDTAPPPLISVAAFYNVIRVADVLLEYGTKLEGSGALEMAVGRGNEVMVRYFTDHNLHVLDHEYSSTGSCMHVSHASRRSRKKRAEARDLRKIAETQETQEATTSAQLSVMYHHISAFSTFAVLGTSLAIASALSSNSQSSNSTKQWTFDEISSSTSLIWYPCFSDFFCAMLDVPLDYSKTNGTRASVPLIMIAAQNNSTDGPYQGMILTNPVVGTNYDIVSFDPRGMGRSIPLADCSSSLSSKIRRRNFGLSGPEFDSSYWTEEFQKSFDFGAECNAKIGGSDQAGPHMSMAVVATDMLSIVDAFAKTERGQSVETLSLLNYWGFSYGSFLGQTFASMYPDRVGRFAIDGVVDPDDYISGAELDDIYLEDAVIDSFFTYCHLAGTSLCDFYTGNSSEDIRHRFENIFLPLNASYAFAQNWTNATTIQHSLESIKSTIRLTAYTPITSFPILATQLVAYEAALSNLTIAAIESASNIGTTTTNIIGTLPELPEWLPGVFLRRNTFNLWTDVRGTQARYRND